jgi:hypothetical protein
MTKEEIRKAMEELSEDYEIVAIRTQEEPFELGAITHCSHIWEDGDDTGEELDGICGTTVNGLALHEEGYYFGGHQAIIAGNRYSWGEDEDEVIIEDAEVLMIIK